ncbi:hypothetical protein QBC47DRAFT_458667 [Echria macrotheca]|uniref:Chitin biosynthesis protein n=1 Tax=Echria macrotheca TaxID=438768 RepID=A0AAJ0FEB3_9PEZI|nr:hypothetical protein QBC47DRAFT_458667 [Echria macrotheca]
MLARSARVWLRARPCLPLRSHLHQGKQHDDLGDMLAPPSPPTEPPELASTLPKSSTYYKRSKEIQAWSKKMKVALNFRATWLSRKSTTAPKISVGANYCDYHSIHRYDEDKLKDVHALNYKWMDMYQYFCITRPLWVHIYYLISPPQKVVVKRRAKKLVQEAVRKALSRNHYNSVGMALEGHEDVRGTELYGTLRMVIYDAQNVCQARYSKEFRDELVDYVEEMITPAISRLRRPARISPSWDQSLVCIAFSLTVGKVDAGVTVLLTPDKRLIEFPSILLPPDISSGSIVDITVARNTSSEAAAERAFRALQDEILSSFGSAEPTTPVLRCRNATQTSVVLEWDPIQLATADLLSLALYRNGQKAGNIPKPLAMHSTKISGLAVDTEYTFHLVLRTSAGTYTSERVSVRTHKMTDLSGITITMGILPAATRDSLARAVERIGAKIVDGVRIDTTHFVTTEGRGLAWEKANELNIPVVRPEWVEMCEQNGRIWGVTKFYLDAVRFEMPTTHETRAPVAEKELPSVPERGAEPASEPSSAGPPPGKDENEARKEEAVSSESDEDSEEEEEQKVRSPGQEQKVLAEEGLATRLKATVADVDEESSEESSKGGKSPAGGGSFQDVAL